MAGYESLSHSRWDCKYHVVFILPKNVGESNCLVQVYTGVSLKILIDFNEHIDFTCKF